MTASRSALLACVLFSSLAVAGKKKLDLGTLKWSQSLKEAGVTEFNVCGTEEIQNSVSSFQRNFFIGKQKKAYLLSGLLSNDEYWKILKTENLSSGKEEIKKAFSKTVLWEISENGEVNTLGPPSEVKTPFTATVKDCVEGAKTTLGSSCLGDTAEQRESCCSEKFVGPKVIWKGLKGGFVLHFSPDPSIRLKVPDEKANRFCHSLESVIF
jgi:hypothetical protein